MTNKLVILFVVLIAILGFNILSMLDVIPKKIANIVYIVFSIIGLFTLLKMGAFNGIGKDLKTSFDKQNDKIKKDEK